MNNTVKMGKCNGCGKGVPGNDWPGDDICNECEAEFIAEFIRLEPWIDRANNISKVLQSEIRRVNPDKWRTYTRSEKRDIKSIIQESLMDIFKIISK